MFARSMRRSVVVEDVAGPTATRSEDRSLQLHQCWARFGLAALLACLAPRPWFHVVADAAAHDLRHALDRHGKRHEALYEGDHKSSQLKNYFFADAAVLRG
jgi:hypothetical protein